MSYQVRLEQVAPLPTVVMRRLARRSELSRIVPQACGEVWSFLRAQQISGGGRHVAIYLDGEIHLEVGVIMAQPITSSSPASSPNSIVSSTTPAGLAATTTHLGPYQLLGAAHQAVQDWCRTQGHSLAGPSWEIYGHWTDDVSQLRTDVYWLLR